MQSSPPSGPVLVSARVTLRPFRPDDASRVALACQDPEIPKFTMMEEGLTQEKALEWIVRRNQLQEAGLFALAITVNGADECVGQIGAFVDAPNRRAETFYWIDRSQRRRGITSEALTLITDWVFADHDVVRAHLLTHPNNEASQRVAARSGYQREGILRAWEPIKDAQPDVVMWSRLATDPNPSEMPPAPNMG